LILLNIIPKKNVANYLNVYGKAQWGVIVILLQRIATPAARKRIRITPQTVI